MIDSVIDLNNVGVAYLEAGDNDMARRYFKNALDQATALLQPNRAVTAHCHQSRIHLAPRVIPISSKRLKYDVGSYVYSQALSLSKECFTHCCGETFCHRESIVITFNLALVHHLTGITLHTSKFLVLALRLYELSSTLLRGLTGYEAHYMHLALFNNMGQIYYELAEYDMAATCFARLKESLVSEAMVVLEPDVLSGFFMNLLFLDAPNNAAAA